MSDIKILQEMPYKELKGMAKELGINTVQKKVDLIEQIADWYNQLDLPVECHDNDMDYSKHAKFHTELSPHTKDIVVEPDESFYKNKLSKEEFDRHILYNINNKIVRKIKFDYDEYLNSGLESIEDINIYVFRTKINK